MNWVPILPVAVRPASATLLSAGGSAAIAKVYPASGIWMIVPGGRAILRENLTVMGGPYFTTPY